MKERKFFIWMLLIFAEIQVCNCQQNFYKISKNNDLRGCIKTMKMFSYNQNHFDTLNFNREMSFDKIPKYIYHYRKDGLIEKEIINIIDGSQNVISFKYDEQKNIISKRIRNNKNILMNKDYDYEFDYKSNQSIEIINGKKNNILTKFNSQGKTIEKLYFTNEKKINQKIKFHYDVGRIISKTIWKNDILEEQYFYTYDSLERKISTLYIGKDGLLKRKIINKYENDFVTVFLDYDKNNVLTGRTKKVIFRDDKNNVIKEYLFNPKKKSTHVFEFQFEYY